MVASLALSVALTPTKPTGSFFMLPTRAWEMLAGGLVYLAASHVKLNALQQRLLEYAGIATIAFSIAVFEPSVAWPGWRAMVPVLGSMLVLLAARNNSPLTGNAVAQWLGTRSYSIYLWHWPITVGLRYVAEFDQPLAMALGLALTCLLGDVSYRVVENYTREYLGRRSYSRGLAPLLLGVTAIASASEMVLFKNGFVGRLRPDIEMVSGEQFNTNGRRTPMATPNCSKRLSCIERS
jgi:peptidoglycan/LPS O-acetylase OafA/YrhL